MGRDSMDSQRLPPGDTSDSLPILEEGRFCEVKNTSDLTMEFALCAYLEGSYFATKRSISIQPGDSKIIDLEDGYLRDADPMCMKVRVKPLEDGVANAEEKIIYPSILRWFARVDIIYTRAPVPVLELQLIPRTSSMPEPGGLKPLFALSWVQNLIDCFTRSKED